MKKDKLNKTIQHEEIMFETEAGYAVAIASKILEIEKPEIDFVNSEFLHGKSITSMYIPTHNLILFNQDWLVVAKVEEVILTSFHETRHAYQKVQIDGQLILKQNEKPETIAKWRKEFEKYYRPSDQYLDDPEYLEQEIEKDASEFSHKAIELFSLIK
jgi:hypothetical protein